MNKIFTLPQPQKINPLPRSRLKDCRDDLEGGACTTYHPDTSSTKCHLCFTSEFRSASFLPAVLLISKRSSTQKKFAYETERNQRKKDSIILKAGFFVYFFSALFRLLRRLQLFSSPLCFVSSIGSAQFYCISTA